MTAEILKQELEKFDKELPPELVTLTNNGDIVDELSNCFSKAIIMVQLNKVVESKIQELQKEYRNLKNSNNMSFIEIRKLIDNWNNIVQFRKEVTTKYNL